MGAYADDRADWIVEGLAEYYSLELLMRSGTLDPTRVQEQFDMAVASYEAGSTKGPGSSRTWRGVGYFVRLDTNIEARTEGKFSLDDVLRVLVALPGASDLAKLRAAVAEATGLDPDEVLPPPPARREPRAPSGGTGASKSTVKVPAPEDPERAAVIETESFSVPLPIETPAPGE
jgi:predicted metalloprotease with PDZ domain